MIEKYIVERTEDGIVTLEQSDGNKINIDAGKIPFNVHTGEVLNYSDGIFSVDNDESEKRKTEILRKHKSVFGKN